jgi:pyruvate carboxylase
MDLAEQMVDHGIHSLGIKDMAGLLKPKAATELVGALRARYPDLVIHVHTHDSAGTAVATQIAAAEAGADIVDCAIDSMSGLTSQPSMGAIVNSLAGTKLDTGINPRHMLLLSNYWCVLRACLLLGVELSSEYNPCSLSHQIHQQLVLHCLICIMV